tara:strand:+ start:238 stop:444 length:207 start_codon:yes stop_codon:yes gene_type:complete
MTLHSKQKSLGTGRAGEPIFEIRVLSTPEDNLPIRLRIDVFTAGAYTQLDIPLYEHQAEELALGLSIA